MTDAVEIRVPLLNPNEREVQLVALHVSVGDSVAAGDLICTLETTKSTAEVAAPQDGYIVGLRGGVGDRLIAGEILCWLADDEAWEPPAQVEVDAEAARGLDGLQITEPALALANELGLDLDSLPREAWITQDVVRSYAYRTESFELSETKFNATAIVVYGGGGHGKSIIDLIRLLGDFEVVGVLDDGLAAGSQVMGVTILGGAEILGALRARGVEHAVNAVGGVGDMMSRVRVFEKIRESGYECPTLVHPTAFIETSAALDDGIQVFPHAYIGSEVRVGFGVIVNTGAVVSHDCVVAAYANIAPGALLAGGVSIGEGALIGMGTTINLNVSIGAGARVGNSAVVKTDVPTKGIVRAGAVWPTRDADIKDGGYTRVDG